MSTESYYYYLQFLNLPRNSNEGDIRTAINKLYRVYTKQTESNTTEKRHEAERQSEILEKAEKVLLGAEGQIIRINQDDQGHSNTGMLHDINIDPDTVAGAIERFVSQRGRKVQERQGTALYKRATTFYNGLEYTLVELKHKKYQINLDEKKCYAVQDGCVLFEWHSQFNGISIEGYSKTYQKGPWVEDIINASSGIGIENFKEQQ